MTEQRKVMRAYRISVEVDKFLKTVGPRKATAFIELKVKGSAEYRRWAERKMKK